MMTGAWVFLHDIIRLLAWYLDVVIHKKQKQNRAIDDVVCSLSLLPFYLVLTRCLQSPVTAFHQCFRYCVHEPISKHILNAQVSIRSPCCRQWFDCAECHAEVADHKLSKTMEMIFMCKKCKKAFRKDMSAYEESDEYCPHCDNHYVSINSF